MTEKSLFDISDFDEMVHEVDWKTVKQIPDNDSFEISEAMTDKEIDEYIKSHSKRSKKV